MDEIALFKAHGYKIIEYCSCLLLYLSGRFLFVLDSMETPRSYGTLQYAENLVEQNFNKLKNTIIKYKQYNIMEVFNSVPLRQQLL